MNTDSTLPSTILRSILVQLLRRTDVDWLSEFKDLSTAKKDNKNPPNGLSDLANLIRRASRLYQSKRVVIAIDALDECQSNSQRRNLLRLLNSNRPADLSVFVTSRDEHEFRVAFDGLPSISLDNVKTSLESDMRLFISSELEGHYRFSKSPVQERDEIVGIIVKRAEGMYVFDLTCICCFGS